MIFVRLALKSDMTEIVEMGAANCEETCPGEDFDPAMAAQAVQDYLDKAATTFFIVEDRGRILGFLQAGMWGYDYRAGLFTTQKVLYVKPENRGTRAAVLLVKELIRWSRQIGADRIEGGNDNSFRSERTAKFLSHFGFEKVGYAMRMKLD